LLAEVVRRCLATLALLRGSANMNAG